MLQYPWLPSAEAAVWGTVIIFLTLICIQILEKFFEFFLLLYLRKKFGILISYRGPGPVLHRFYGKDIRFLLPGRTFPADRKSDRVYFECEKLTARLSLPSLLIGRILITDPVIRTGYLEYINRELSHKKNRLLPARHRFELKDLEVHNSSVYVIDETMLDYRLLISKIEITGADMDIATPVDLFFRMKSGHAVLGSGSIETGRSRNTGYIRLKGITWAEITSLNHVPFLGTGFSLKATHTGGTGSREVEGTVSITGADQGGIPFQFSLLWDHYKLTMDLGIQRLIHAILDSARPGLAAAGLVLGTKGVFDMIKKPESEPPQEDAKNG